jgi:hypothetical protein
METKSTFDNAVERVRYRPGASSLALALDLCQGLLRISSYTQILNKRESMSCGDTDQSHHSIQVYLKGER